MNHKRQMEKQTEKELEGDIRRKRHIAKQVKRKTENWAVKKSVKERVKVTRGSS